MLQLMPIEIPEFDPVVMPEIPPELVVPEMPGLITAYATVIQDFIDSKIRDFDSYKAPLEVIRNELMLTRNQVFRKYHKARRELLQKEGKKNLSLMPGYLMRQLEELLVDEKRDITEAQLKLVAERANAFLETISWVMKAGFESAALRSETTATVSELNLEILNEGLKAGLEVTLQNVTRANDIIKLTGLLIEQETVQSRIANLAVIKLIAEQQIEKVNLDILLYEIQARGIMAELDVLAAKLVAAENEVLILNAQLQRSAAEWQVAIAQEALAAMKVITATWERQKSEARKAAAALEGPKMDARVDKVEAEMVRVEALAKVEKAELALDVANKKLDLLRDELEIARKKAEVALTEIKGEILSDEVMNLGKRTENIYTYIVQRTEHTATAIGNIESQSAKATANIDSQVSYIGQQTDASSKNVDTAILGISAVSSEGTANTNAEIREINAESAASSGLITGEIENIWQITEQAELNTTTVIEQTTEESQKAQEIVNQKVEAMRTESAANTASVDLSIGNQKALIEMQKDSADTQIRAMEGAAYRAMRNAITAASIESMTKQLEVLDKKEALEESLEADFSTWQEKVQEIADTKREAIIGAARNAANAKLSSKHIYRSA